MLRAGGTFIALMAIAVCSHACEDCDKKCCKKIFGAKVCEPTCETACAAFNASTCGKIQLPPLSPITPANLDTSRSAVLLTLLTGGVINPVNRKPVNDAISDLGKAVSQGSKEANKAGQNLAAEAGRAARNVQNAGDAIEGYIHDRVQGQIDSATKSLDELREGRITDALWHMSTDDLKNEDHAAAKAAMKSEIVRTVGQVGATAYGGPGGAAAYAAWLTFHQSGGDVNLALKVGVITGAASYAFESNGQLASVDASGHMIAGKAAQKVVIAGAIGGLAVAAAGGNEDAIRKGFLQAGAMVLIQEGYQSYTGHPLNDHALKGAKGDAYCVSSTVECQEPPKAAYVYDKDGKFIGWDQSKLDPAAPHVGMGYPDTAIDKSAITWPTEGSPLMKNVALVPGANAMAVFHDQWAVGWKMPPGVLQATIVPAIVITYAGTTAPLLESVRTAAVQDHQTEGGGGALSVTVNTDDVSKGPPVNPENVETSFICARAGDSRSILVEVDPRKKDFACRVIYRSNSTRKIPWNAASDSVYCEAKAEALARQQLDYGYHCLVGQATPRKS